MNKSLKAHHALMNFSPAVQNKTTKKMIAVAVAGCFAGLVSAAPVFTYSSTVDIGSNSDLVYGFTAEKGPSNFNTIAPIVISTDAVVLDGLTIANQTYDAADNHQFRGLGVAAADTKLIISNADISGNKVAASGNSGKVQGVGLYVVQSDLTIRNSTLSHNEAHSQYIASGAALNAQRSNVTLENVRIEGNKAIVEQGPGVNKPENYAAALYVNFFKNGTSIV